MATKNPDLVAQNAGDLLSGLNHFLGVAQGSNLRGAGRNAANRAASPDAALTRSSTVMRRTRSISACREAAPTHGAAPCAGA